MKYQTLLGHILDNLAKLKSSPSAVPTAYINETYSIGWRAIDKYIQVGDTRCIIILLSIIYLEY